MSVQEKTRSFLAIAPQFQLGHLLTESFHPKTSELSRLVKDDVAKAHELLREVDRDALGSMAAKEEAIAALADDIQATLSAGHKVYMVGCGATGRLSLVLETLYRQLNPKSDQVIAFMAGGDYALIKSVESFEDRTEYGERQLMDLGFGPHDLLLAPTEGGETPFVIGATLAAARVSSRSPYFLYCNPDELLAPIQRSREVIQDPRIKKVNLTVGPMAISGSTRMQASTALMLAIGVGLLRAFADRKALAEYYHRLLKDLSSVPYSSLAPLTSLEARLYQEGKFLNYVSDPSLAISILTDTTERSPTFSLRGFENHLENDPGHCLSYLFLSEGETSAHAWSELLRRPPRALTWKDLPRNIGPEMVLGFDISLNGLKQRQQQVPSVTFSVKHVDQTLVFACEGQEARFKASSDPLCNHLLAKMLLNAHSTLIMGLLGRYEGNVMTYVRPSNNKLIDRAARYAGRLLERRGKKVGYEKIVEAIFTEMERTEERPVVLRVVDRLS